HAQACGRQTRRRGREGQGLTGGGASRAGGRRKIVLQCEVLHARDAGTPVWWRGHRAIGDGGSGSTIALLGVSSLDWASPGAAGEAFLIFSGPLTPPSLRSAHPLPPSPAH